MIRAFMPIARRRLVALAAVAAGLMQRSHHAAAASPGDAQGEVVVTRAAALPPRPAPAGHFTGQAEVSAPFQARAPARVSGGIVTFAAGARTAWHTHPLGQTLVVLSGAGLVQHWGKGAERIAPGDVVWISPGVKHWHGAGLSGAMSHLAVSEALDGKTVDWLEHVSDADHAQASAN